MFFFTPSIGIISKWIPKVGFTALNIILNSKCKEAYITGFTFFKTPYTADYRSQLTSMKANQEHIKNQGLHNPDLELTQFIKQKESFRNSDNKIILDSALTDIVNSFK